MRERSGAHLRTGLTVIVPQSRPHLATPKLGWHVEERLRVYVARRAPPPGAKGGCFYAPPIVGRAVWSVRWYSYSCFPNLLHYFALDSYAPSHPRQSNYYSA